MMTDFYREQYVQLGLCLTILEIGLGILILTFVARLFLL